MVYEGYTDFFEKPVIISVAATGGLNTGGLYGEDPDLDIPEGPEEIADDIRACEKAGASIVHFHALDEDGNETRDVERYQELRDIIDERCDDVIVNLTAGGGYSLEERIRPVLELEPSPEIATLGMGPVNYGKDTIRNYTRGVNEEFATKMVENGVKPELEVFNPGQYTEVYHLIEEGYLEKPYWMSLILGSQNGTYPCPRNLLNLVDNVPEGTEWQCIAYGEHQLPMMTLAMVLGGHVRVGLEDSLHYREDEPAQSNEQLVRRIARIADELNRPIADASEARDILGLS